MGRRMKYFKLIMFGSLVSLGLGISASAGELWNCPDGEYARKAYISGEVKNWPYYTDGHGARVQRQFPDTALVAQAKFITLEKSSGAICQYYSHIGLTGTFYVVGATKAEVKLPAYWRKEFRNSTPEEDKPGEELMDVCMVRVGKLAKPSIACPFILSGEKTNTGKG